MPRRLRMVALGSLATALILVLPGGQGSALTNKQCWGRHKVCIDRCHLGHYTGPCEWACDAKVMDCFGSGPKQGTWGRPDSPKKGIDGASSATWVPDSPKKGIDGASSATWVPNSPKKGINGTSSGTWVPNSPAKGKG